MSAKRGAEGPAVAKPNPSKKPSRRTRILKVVKWLLIVTLVGMLALATTGYIVYKNTSIPDPNAEFLTETSHIYYSDGKTELGQLAVQKRDSIGFDEMPACIKDGVVAAENQSFWTDNGIDPKGIVRAAFSNAKGNATQGASTITQQYVKILYLTQERSIKRKVKEAFLSLKIRNELSKQQILEGYLNTIYFGRGAYGIEAASQAYFNKDAKNLEIDQCAVLASVVNNPVGLDPANGDAAEIALKSRYDYVLSQLVKMDKISAGEAEEAEQSLPKFPKQKAEDTYGGQRGHTLTLIKSQLLKLENGDGDPLFTEEQITGGGLEITTTLTKQAMDAAEAGVEEVRPDLGKDNKNLHVGVASVEPGTGALRGFYGGHDFLKSQINWAVAGGAPGSAFKPFAVAAGIKAGYSLKDTFDGNSPYQLPGGGDVVNEGAGGGTSYGTVSLLEATEDSINTAFIDMTLGMPDGPQAIMDTAVDMGIPPEKAKVQDHRASPPAPLDCDPRPASRWVRQPRARSTWRTPTAPSRTTASARTSTSSTRSSTATARPSTTTRSATSGRSRRTSTTTSPSPCSRSSRTAQVPRPRRSFARPPARPAPQRTETATCPRHGSWASRHSWPRR